MAKPSKRHPWVVQMLALDKWYNAGAYSDQETAEMMAALACKRAPETEWRVSKIGENNKA